MSKRLKSFVISIAVKALLICRKTSGWREGYPIEMNSFLPNIDANRSRVPMDVL
jgi:hypothetical protein